MNTSLKKKIKRILRIPDREEVFSSGVAKTDKILEIGPSHSPLFPKRDGWNVSTIDLMSKDELREHYKTHGVNLDAIEDVDYIWDKKSYTDSVGRKSYFDYVIASHVIEHTTNLVGFLNDCSDLLKDGGELRLAVPDKRYIFDHFRGVTGLGEVLNNYYYPNDVQNAGMVGEYLVSVVKYKESSSWGKKFIGIANKIADNDLKNYSFIHDEEYALHTMDEILKTGEYYDIHHYCFTPASFEYLIYELGLLKLIKLKITKITPTCHNEFLVYLQKSDEYPQANEDTKKRLLWQLGKRKNR